MPKAPTFFAALLTCVSLSTVARAESPAMRPYVTISDTTCPEGDSGKKACTVQVSMYGWYDPLTVSIVATPGTASDNDYDFTPTEVTLQPYGSGQDIIVSIVGDAEPEGDEYFTLTARMVGDASFFSLITQGGTITIQDDEQAIASRLHIEGAAVLEGNAGTTEAEVRVRLEPASANVVMVSYQSQDSTATAESDYTPVSGKLIFAPGEVLKTIPIQILADTILEGDETLSVVLTQPSMALLGTSSTTVTIANDDAPAIPNIADLSVDEGDQGDKTVPIRITFDRPVPALARFHYFLIGAGAVAGADFRKDLQTAYPPVGATEFTFKIDIISDTTPECDEGFFIQYEGENGIDSTVRRAQVLIRNDDGQVANCDDPFNFVAPVESPRDGGVDLLPAPTIPDSGSQPDPVSTNLDSGAPMERNAQFASSCECSLGRGTRALPAPFALLALAGLFLALARRRESK